MSCSRTIGTDGSASRTAPSIVARSVAGGSVVRSTTFIKPGTKLNGAGLVAV